MIKLIIFDFDGVIITGSHEGYFNCYHKALESVGVKLGTEEEKSRAGHLSKKEAEDLDVKHIVPDIAHLPALLKNLP